jgi:hypothetical protein
MQRSCNTFALFRISNRGRPFLATGARQASLGRPKADQNFRIPGPTRALPAAVEERTEFVRPYNPVGPTLPLTNTNQPPLTFDNQPRFFFPLPFLRWRVLLHLCVRKSTLTAMRSLPAGNSTDVVSMQPRAQTDRSLQPSRLLEDLVSLQHRSRHGTSIRWLILVRLCDLSPPPASHEYGSGMTTNLKELLARSGLHERVQFYVRHFYGSPDGVAEGPMTEELLVYALGESERKGLENQDNVRRL